MAENWNAYIATFNDKPTVFFIDLGLREEVPMASHPWRVMIRVPLLTTNENGWPLSEELEVLSALDDALCEQFERENAFYAGRLTQDGKRLMVFYVPRKINPQPYVSAVKEKYPEYEFEAWIDEDPEWHFYTCTLYPSPEEMQVLKNRMVLDALEKDGDTLVVPRELNHWIYFEDPDKRYEFVSAVTAFGYRADCETDERWQPRPYRAMLSRVDRVDPESIDETVLQLFRLANHYEGEYDGWETPVVRPAQAPLEKPWWKKIF